MAMLGGTPMVVGTLKLAVCEGPTYQNSMLRSAWSGNLSCMTRLEAAPTCGAQHRCRTGVQLQLPLMRLLLLSIGRCLDACLCECGLSRKHNHVILRLERLRFPDVPLQVHQTVLCLHSDVAHEHRMLSPANPDCYLHAP